MPSSHSLLSAKPSKLMPGRNTTLRTSAQMPSWVSKALKFTAFQKGGYKRQGRSTGFKSLIK